MHKKEINPTFADNWLPFSILGFNFGLPSTENGKQKTEN